VPCFADAASPAPTLYSLWANTEKVCEHGLACVQAFSDMPNFLRFEDLGWSWNLRHPQVNLLPTLIHQRVRRVIAAYRRRYSP